MSPEASPKGKPAECISLAMLVADKVFREEGTGKCHIAGTFSRVEATNFPVFLAAMHVYIAITDLSSGKHQGRLQFVYEGETTEELMRLEGPLVSPAKREVIELHFCLNALQFPKAGTIRINFFVNDHHVGSRKFQVVKK
jgi:hypothetical protein